LNLPPSRAASWPLPQVGADPLGRRKPQLMAIVFSCLGIRDCREKFVRILLLFIGSSTLTGATWKVEKDGSGDFTLIQDAINTASPGDTIQIGTGRFEDLASFKREGAQYNAHAVIDLSELTVQGAGANETIIGPPTGPGTNTSPYGIVGTEISRTTIERLTVENCIEGISVHGPSTRIEGALLRQNQFGVQMRPTDWGAVRNSMFSFNSLRGIIVFAGDGSQNVTVERCQFEGDALGLDFQSQDNVVRDCTFSGTIVGLQFSFGATGTVQRCFFSENIGNVGLGLLDASSATLTDSRFAQVSTTNVNVSNGSNLTGSGNVFHGGGQYTIRIVPTASIDLRESHIFNNGGWSALVETGVIVPKTFDLRDNYWGTTDAAQIVEWIHDGTDDGSGSEILFEPFYDHPVPIKATGFGNLKSLFSGTGTLRTE